jgi:SagB-type dehydrogenase family enzyme
MLTFMAMIADRGFGDQTLKKIALPKPDLDEAVTLQRSLQERHSTREFGDAPVGLGELSQILWAAQGINSEHGGRTAPSAGALYPLELFVVAGRVDDLGPGVYRYRIRQHDLVRERQDDLRAALARAALDQEWLADAAAVLVISAVFERTTRKYGSRGRRYVHMEAGIAAQNVHLMVAALGLGTTIVGAFDDGKVQRVLELERECKPLILMPIGWPR